MKRYVFAACLAGVSMAALAQTSVTIYGIVDEYVDMTSTGQYHANRLQSGGISGSRLGFKGREDLGGGYAGIFTLEMGLNADDGSLGQGGLGFGRQSFVGIETPYGDITLGRQYTQFFNSLAAYAVGGGLSFGNAANYFSDGSMLRFNNSVVYTSKAYSGFSAQAAYAFGETANSNIVGNVAAAGIYYASGPLAAGASYTRRKTTLSNVDQYVVAGAAYDFKFVKTGFLVSTRRDDNRTHESNMVELSALVPIAGTSAAIIDLGRFQNRSVSNANATSLSMRYDYYLSKRTTLYTGVAKIRNDGNANFGINGATGSALAVAAGGDPRTVVLGIRHLF